MSFHREVTVEVNSSRSTSPKNAVSKLSIATPTKAKTDATFSGNDLNHVGRKIIFCSHNISESQFIIFIYILSSFVKFTVLHCHLSFVNFIPYPHSYVTVHSCLCPRWEKGQAFDALLTALCIRTFARDHWAKSAFARDLANVFHDFGCLAKTRFIVVPCRSWGAFQTKWVLTSKSRMTWYSAYTKLDSSSRIWY